MILKGKVKILVSGAGTMVQLDKCLLHKCEELNLDLHAHASTEPCVFDPSSGEEIETGDPLELTG